MIPAVRTRASLLTETLTSSACTADNTRMKKSMEQWYNEVGRDEGCASANSVKHKPNTDRPAIETGLFI